MMLNIQKDRYIIALLYFLLSSCNNDGNGFVDINQSSHFTSFSFLTGNNPQMTNDIVVNILENNGDTIKVFVPHLKTDSLVATFSGDFVTAEVGG